MYQILSAPGNYQACKKRDIQYLVIHYTANDGDTARGNLSYFSRTTVQASAHYFVDEKECCRSVPDMDIAWHCGASSYKHPACRNANSIGVELCSRKDSAGNYYFMTQTVKNAAELVKSLMKQYGIDREHVLRHYDVTGKICPAPMVNDPNQWKAFLALLEEEKEVEVVQSEPSVWAKEAAEWAVAQGLIQGDGNGEYQWQSPVTREALAVILKRLSEQMAK